MRAHRGEAGYSLLEALVSVLLTSFVILGLAGSLLAAIKSSEVADRVQRADSALGSFTESLKTMPYPTVVDPGNCPSLEAYQDAWDSYADAWPAPQGVTLAITEIEHWQPSGTDVGAYTDDCPDPSGDPFTHRLTVSVEIKGKERQAQVVVTQR